MVVMLAHMLARILTPLTVALLCVIPESGGRIHFVALWISHTLEFSNIRAERIVH